MTAPPDTASRRSPARLRAAFKLGMLDALIAQPIVVMALPVNTFLSLLFVRQLRLGAAAIGIMTAIPAACQVVQLPFMARFAGRGSTKAVTIAGSLVQLAAWLGLGAALPYFALEPRRAPMLTALLLAVIGLSGAVTGVGWFGWLHEWVPPSFMARFFSARNRLAQIAMLAFVTALGFYLLSANYAVSAFQAVIFFAGTLRAGSIWLLWRMNPVSHPDRIERPSPLLRQLALLRQDQGFRRVVLLSVIWGFAASCFGPFYVVFELERLGMSAATVCVAQAIEILAGVMVLPAWGRIIDRNGFRSPMLISLLTWQAGMLSWCALTPHNWWLLFVLAVWTGATSGGFLVGLLPILLRHIPGKAKSLGIATSQALVSCTMAVAALIGGATLQLGLRTWNPHADGVYHLCFLLQPLLSIGAALVLMGIPERSRMNAPIGRNQPAVPGAVLGSP